MNRNRQILRHVMLISAALITLYPLVWMIGQSLKERREFFLPTLFPEVPQWGNYVTAWVDGNFARYYLNSAFVTVTSVLLGLLIASMLAFAVSRLNFRGSTVLFYMFIAAMMFPPQLGLVPLYLVMRNLQLLDTYGALILPYINGAIPITLFLLHGFFQAIPQELDEAAVVDGANTWQIYWLVILPLSVPALATAAVIVSLGTWNDFLLPLTFIQSPELRTVPLAVFRFQLQPAVDNPVIMAALTLGSVPIVVLFLCLQRYLVQGITGGALK